MSSAVLPTPTLHRETRLSIAPPTPNTVLNIQIGKTQELITTGRKRAFEEISEIDEETYARKHLATEGSVFSRPKSRAPRNFLWRVLNDRHTLELQCVDLVQEKRHRGSDSWLTFRVTLPVAITPKGVALADDEAKDALDIFVIAGDTLYTVTLRRDLLTRETVPVDFDPTSVYKSFGLGAKGYRITAVSSLIVLVSLETGDFIRLQREPNNSGELWHKDYIGEGGLNLKGFLSRKIGPAIQHGELNLKPNAMIALAMSPDRRHVWTIDINYTLKAWAVGGTGKPGKLGKPLTSLDLLEDSIGQEDRRRQAHIDPGQGTLLQVVDVSGPRSTAYYLVCYSPKDHRFRFLQVNDDEEEPAVCDVQSTHTALIAPVAVMLGTALWNLEEFHISPGPRWSNSRIWLRARSGPFCRIFTLAFDLLDDRGFANDLSEAWSNDWTYVEDSSLSIQSLERLPDFPARDIPSDTISTPSEKWLKFLFYPGRFSEASLEAALGVYRKNRGLPHASKGFNAVQSPLKERITEAVTAKILLRGHANGQPDYDTYQGAIHKEWEAYFTVLSRLHSLRLASIGFAYDDEDGMPWAICADMVAPIRESSAFELVADNAELIDSRDHTSLLEEIQSTIWPNPEEDLLKSQILAVARQFRQYLGPASQEKLRIAAVSEALDQSADKSALLGLQNIYDQCGIDWQIGDEEFDAINEAASVFDGLGSLNDDSLLMVLEAIDNDGVARGTESGRALQIYGKDMSIAIAQRTLQETQAVLLDVLALVLFMHGDLEPDELDQNFRAHEMYDSIIFRLKLTELRLWLVSHVRLEPKKVDSTKDESMAMTLYESFFIGDWHSHEDGQPRPMSQLITDWSKIWTLGIALNENWTGVTDDIMASLIQCKEYELAQDFAKFLSENTPWATYLKGRLHLGRGEYDMASLAFTEAADELAQASDDALALFESVLSPQEVGYFGQGLSKYFQHISGLYEALRAFSYTAEYCYLAAQHLQSERDLRRELREFDKRKSRTGPDSPAPARADMALEEIKLLKIREARDSILGRLFNALHQTDRFDEAYRALAQMTDLDLRRSNLKTLIGRCIKEDAVPDLLSLPIAEDLVQTVDAELLRFAKRSMGTSNTQLSGPPYHQILFAFRTQHNDFRGAASLLYTHLEYLKYTNPHAVKDPDDDTLIQAYVLLINTLVCCGQEEAWLLAEAIEGVHPAGTKRRLVRLEDVRREYTDELDRRSEVQMGRFAILGADDMDMF